MLVEERLAQLLDKAASHRLAWAEVTCTALT
jgi:hypothetical protein